MGQDMNVERRRTQRHRVDLGCVIELVIPTATERPGRQSARMVDVSEGGARVVVPKSSKRLFQRLLRGKAYAKLWMQLETRAGRKGPELNLAGRIAWMDFDSQRGELRLGLEFDAADAKTAASARSIVEAVAGADGGHGLSSP